jgi:excisionase family DNA binding protein
LRIKGKGKGKVARKQFSVSESSNPPSLLGQALLDAIRQAVKEAIREVGANGQQHGLLDPEELAGKLKVPVSWVYEQSRQGRIPTHRLGRYIRFDLHEVLKSQKKS